MVLLIEAHRGVTDGVRAILEGLEGQVPARVPVALAINKIDRVPAEKLLGAVGRGERGSGTSRRPS